MGQVFKSCFVNGGKRLDVMESRKQMSLKSLKKVLQDRPREQQVEALKR